VCVAQVRFASGGERHDLTRAGDAVLKWQPARGA
jgi:hypothetical protein